MDGDKLRDGIFSLRTRRFGSVAEFMIKRMEKCGKSQNQFHDLYDDVKRRRIEVKFSVVLKKADTPISESTVLKCIEEATSAERMVAFSEWEKNPFDCNIQQIKRAEFDVLYWRVVPSCRFVESEFIDIAAAVEADFGSEEFLEDYAFG
jgi:hypothetical protein